jgi:phosphoribosyl 1,2-cyclic phosphodiesterase
MMRFKSLGSGSSGNATLVETTSGTHTTRLLIDCGLRLRDLDARLQEAGTQASELSAIFITHEHGDHIGCAHSLVRRHPTPIWMSHGTWQAVHNATWESLRTHVNVAKDGDVLAIGDLQARPFTVPHDAREPLQLRCSNGDRQLGIVTDLGHVSSHVVQALQGCHALLLEANHDQDLLAQSAYPEFLKRRVSGPWGHLENAQAAQLLEKIQHTDLHQVLAAHLSERNNTPTKAQTCLSKVRGCQPEEIEVADPLAGSRWITV